MIPCDVSDDVWLKAIGREDYDTDTDPELAPGCCATVGRIRDMLFKCKRDGGMTCNDRHHLQGELNRHEPANVQDALGQIFAQLGVKWI